MPHTDEVETLLCQISALDRRTLTHRLLHFHATFAVDFTPDFLEVQSVDRLKHLLFALCMHCQSMPTRDAA